ncbi:hypothetical protein QTL95_17080 [Rhizobium sp. S152]|uniref:hypothetical protein n=1 Tax=Rhizobium sp. S152 TaxID=3055038 RepID=UPI0025AA2813|nr:hypothetical protein [Rhizobium sp. S152]MDM9627618.1 hypothetical protein [Rhizobium sp. S152]
MEFHLLNRLAEITKRVGPILDELGIRPKIMRDPDGSAFIEFMSSDQKTQSPVEIFLGKDASTTSTNASWKDSKMNATIWENVEIGDTGWTLQEFCQAKHDYRVGEDADAFFAALAEWLPRHGVLFPDRSRDGYTMDEDFAKAFGIIKAALPEDEEIQVNCERGPEADAYVFTYPAGCDWIIEFIGREAIATANAQEVATVDVTELNKLIPAIRTHLKELSARQGPKI